MSYSVSAFAKGAGVERKQRKACGRMTGDEFLPKFHSRFSGVGN